jgi:hypothetical protein
VGLTIREIKRIGDAYFTYPDERIAAALDRSERSADAQLDELLALQRRVRRYRCNSDRHTAVAPPLDDLRAFSPIMSLAIAMQCAGAGY